MRALVRGGNGEEGHEAVVRRLRGSGGAIDNTPVALTITLYDPWQFEMRLEFRLAIIPDE